MDIGVLIEASLGGVDRDRVDIVNLAPVEVAEDAAVGLSAIVAQLVSNATELLSKQGEKVSIGGVAEPSGYSLLIIDHGVGMSDEFLEGLNLILANPNAPDDWSATSGVQLVAALAARYGVGVRLEHGDPGVTARVSIPGRLLEDRVSASVESLVAFVEEPADPEPLLADSPPSTVDTETFLEGVFGPLRGASSVAVADAAADSEVVDIRPTPDLASLPPLEIPEPSEPLQGFRRAKLRTRIPGSNYNDSDPTPTHSKPGEAAVEIKLALDDFTRGRQAATNSVDQEETG